MLTLVSVTCTTTKWTKCANDECFRNKWQRGAFCDCNSADIANTGKVSSWWSVILWNIKGRVWLQWLWLFGIANAARFSGMRRNQFVISSVSCHTRQHVFQSDIHVDACWAANFGRTTTLSQFKPEVDVNHVRQPTNRHSSGRRPGDWLQRNRHDQTSG